MAKRKLPEAVRSSVVAYLQLSINPQTRNANVVPPYETGDKFHGVSSAIEFAVLNLRVRHLIVMGHSGCGGVTAALNQSAAIQTEAQFISRWMSMLDDARLRVLATHPNAPHSERLSALEKEGVKTSIMHLRTFPFIADAENKSKLSLPEPTSTSPPARCRCSTTRATSSSRLEGAKRHPSPSLPVLVIRTCRRRLKPYKAVERPPQLSHRPACERSQAGSLQGSGHVVGPQVSRILQPQRSSKLPGWCVCSCI